MHRLHRVGPVDPVSDLRYGSQRKPFRGILYEGPENGALNRGDKIEVGPSEELTEPDPPAALEWPSDGPPQCPRRYDQPEQEAAYQEKREQGKDRKPELGWLLRVSGQCRDDRGHCGRMASDPPT